MEEGCIFWMVSNFTQPSVPKGCPACTSHNQIDSVAIQTVDQPSSSPEAGIAD